MDETEVLNTAEQAALALVRDCRARINSTAGQFDSSRISDVLIQELEHLKHAISARQIELTAHAVTDAKDRLQPNSSVPPGWAARVTAVAIGFARRRHPVAAARLIHQAQVLTQEMPAVLDAMRAGELGEEQAAILVRETEGLDPTARARVVSEVSDRWQRLGDRGLREAARLVVNRLDPDLAHARAIAAAQDRHVSWRSAPDSMLRLTALLPAREGLACVQALQSDPAVVASSAGDRNRATADALVSRVTGRATGESTPVDVRVNLMIPIEALIKDAPGHLEGYGAIPGHLVRELITACPDKDGPAIRRIFTAPGHEDLIGMESTARTYRGLLREFITLRDQRCRTPFCESDVKHIDHIEPAAEGGPTSAANADAECAHCNYTKELPGYTVTGTARELTYRIGRLTMTSTPPRPPSGQQPEPSSPLERRFAEIIWHGFTAPRRE